MMMMMTRAGNGHLEFGTEVSSISHRKSHHHPNINSQKCNGLKDLVGIKAVQ